MGRHNIKNSKKITIFEENRFGKGEVKIERHIIIIMQIKVDSDSGMEKLFDH